MTSVKYPKEKNSLAAEANGKEKSERKPKISVIWIFSGSDEKPESTLEEYLKELRDFPRSIELIVVNDGAGNVNLDVLLGALEREQLPAKYLVFHRRAGDSAALSAAFKEAAGEILVVLPSYVQIHPGDVILPIRKIEEEGFDFVASWRDPRIDSRKHSRLSALFNWLTRRATGIQLHDLNSGLRAMKRRVIEEVPIYGDQFRFLPVLAAMQGFRIGEVKTRHVAERVMVGDYRPGVYVRRLLDLLTLFFLFKFTRKPLRFFGLIGSGVSAIGILLMGILILQRLLGTPLSNRPLFIISVLLVVLGVQLFSIGLLGELIIFTHAGELQEYKVEKVFESKSKALGDG